jgi:hypothetical protein
VDGKAFWRAIATAADLVPMVRADLAGDVPVLTSTWQYHGWCFPMISKQIWENVFFVANFIDFIEIVGIWRCFYRGN